MAKMKESAIMHRINLAEQGHNSSFKVRTEKKKQGKSNSINMTALEKREPVIKSRKEVSKEV